LLGKGRIQSGRDIFMERNYKLAYCENAKVNSLALWWITPINYYCYLLCKCSLKRNHIFIEFSVLKTNIFLKYQNIFQTGCSTWKYHLLKLLDSYTKLCPKGKAIPCTKSKSPKMNQIHSMAMRLLSTKNKLIETSSIPKAVKDYFLFMFVRHPFDRLVSAFEDKFLLKRDPIYATLAKNFDLSFRNFIGHVIKANENCTMSHCTVDAHWK